MSLIFALFACTAEVPGRPGPVETTPTVPGTTPLQSSPAPALDVPPAPFEWCAKRDFAFVSGTAWPEEEYRAVEALQDGSGDVVVLGRLGAGTVLPDGSTKTGPGVILMRLDPAGKVVWKVPVDGFNIFIGKHSLASAGDRIYLAVGNESIVTLAPGTAKRPRSITAAPWTIPSCSPTTSTDSTSGAAKAT